jgi:hypothetical protein
MSAKKWIALLALVALVALFVPFVPQTQASGSLFGAHYQHTSVVSPTFYAFQCGSFINSRVTATLGTFSGVYQITKGYNFACNYYS